MVFACGRDRVLEPLAQPFGVVRLDHDLNFHISVADRDHRWAIIAVLAGERDLEIAVLLFPGRRHVWTVTVWKLEA